MRKENKEIKILGQGYVIWAACVALIVLAWLLCVVLIDCGLRFSNLVTSVYGDLAALLLASIVFAVGFLRLGKLRRYLFFRNE